VLSWLLGAVGFTLLGTANRRRAGAHRAVVLRESDDERGVPLLLDLLAAVLHSGAPLSRALTVVGERGAQGGLSIDASSRLTRVGRLLDLGSTPKSAWAACDGAPAMRTVAVAGVRCADSGARLAGAVRAAAADLRQTRRVDALRRAERLGVWALLPLGLCFLPAFVCLGVVPVIIGVAQQSLGGR